MGAMIFLLKPAVNYKKQLFIKRNNHKNPYFKKHFSIPRTIKTCLPKLTSKIFKKFF